jgi:fructokinase
MIVVCGEALVDFTPAVCGDGPGYVPHPGGSPYNVAVALARLEVPVAFLGRVSSDAFGRVLREHLARNGVDLRYLREGAEPTTLAFVHQARGAEPEFSFYGEGTADRLLTQADLPRALPPEAAVLHVGSLSLLWEPSASTLESLVARERGRRVVSLDPNVRPALVRDWGAYRRRVEAWVASADLVKASRADAAWLYPGEPLDRVARRWHDLGAAVIVLTLGEEGAWGWTGEGSVSVPAIPVEVVDTVGAGDAFTAGLLAWLWRRGRTGRADLAALPAGALGEALHYASRVAALTCTRAGADPPRRDEVEGRGRHGGPTCVRI